MADKKKMSVAEILAAARAKDGGGAAQPAPETESPAESAPIASVIQHDVSGSSDTGVPLVIMTHACASADVQKAVAAIDTSDVVRGKSVCLSVLEE
jgi:hypothetical protein